MTDVAWPGAAVSSTRSASPAPHRRVSLPAVLSPTQFAALGGDRSVVEAVLDARADLAWLRERAIPHFLTVPEPRLRTLEALPYDLYAVRVE